MEQALQACHVPVQHKCSEETCVSHASFVTDWKPLLARQSSIPESHPDTTNDKSGPANSREESTCNQRLPVFLEAIVRDLQGAKR